MGNPRLYIDQPLGPGQEAGLDAAQAHYLGGVMRLGPGDAIEAFNARDGAWRARIVALGRRGGRVAAEAQTAPPRMPPDLWLVFAPIKKARTDFIVEKATELGCARILPVATEFTQAGRIARDRLQAHAVEAVEQCGGTYVPEVADLQPLARLLDGWNPGRRILWADESLAGPAETLAGLPRGPWAILVGPEGGFSEAERARLRGMAAVSPMSLGPRVLRADTAAVAAIALWQATLGDWTDAPGPGAATQHK